MGLYKTKWKRRSVLFTNSLNENFFKKALDSEADAIAFDLEDSIAEEYKEEARKRLKTLFPKITESNKELIIRINNVRTKNFKADIKLILELSPDTIIISKVESPVDIKLVENKLKQKNIDFIPLIESTNSYKERDKILTSSNKITAVAVGAADMLAELVIMRKPIYEDSLINHIVKEVIISARSLNIQYLDSSFFGYKTKKNLLVLKKECEYLKSIGCSGKLAIHPSQVPIINKTFSTLPITNQEAEEKLRKLRKAIEGTTMITNEDSTLEGLPHKIMYERAMKG